MELLFVMLVCIIFVGSVSIYLVVRFDKIMRTQELLTQKNKESFFKE